MSSLAFEGIPDEAFADLTPELVEGEDLSREFRKYIRAAWPYVETQPLIEGFHIDAMADHAEAVSHGEIENLIVNIPPGCSKSLTFSVLWPSWEWGWAPETRWFMESYDLDLALRDARKTRDLVRTPWYQARWPLRFKGDQDAKGRYENTEGGWRISTMVGGHGTGEHPHRRVTDDPTNREKSGSAVELQKSIDWNDQTMSTRGRSLKVSHVLVMQRLATGDLSGHLMGMAKERGYVILCLPMRYEPKRMMTTPLGWNDPRKREGELLTPRQFNEASVRSMEMTLGTMGAAGQLQQRPVAVGGNVIKHDWLRFWYEGTDAQPTFGPVIVEGKEYTAIPLPKKFDQKIQSMDTSYKDEMGQRRKGREPDPVALGVLGRLKSAIYLLDGIGGVMDAPKAMETLLAMSVKHPDARPRLIEDTANGPAIMALLRRRGFAFIAVTPRGSKMSRVTEAARDQRSRDARALSMAAMIEAGEFYLPHPGMPGFAWVLDLIAVLCAFPNVPHDDWVDMLSQAFGYFARFIERDEKAAAEAGIDEDPPATLAEAVARQNKKIEEEQDEELAEELNADRDGTAREQWLR